MKLILSICENTRSKICKKKCFKNLYDSFPNIDFYILADNLSKDLENFLLSYKIKFYENKVRGKDKYLIEKLDFCIQNFENEEILYLIEDDYIHIETCDHFFTDILDYSDYATLYDHPDKYIQCLFKNSEVDDFGEKTVLFRTKYSHWKYTNSTTGSFACTRKTLYEDIDIWKKYIQEHPNGYCDYLTFKYLRSNKNRKIASSIPARSSHLLSVETLSPFLKFDYNSIIN